MVTPKGLSASATAFTTAAGVAIVPPSPQPLTPPVGHRRRGLQVAHLDRRDLERGRVEVVEQVAGQEVAVLVVAELLVERAADALRRGAR